MKSSKVSWCYNSYSVCVILLSMLEYVLKDYNESVQFEFRTTKYLQSPKIQCQSSHPNQNDPGALVH